jgi:tRNA pseudouridine38-40 synthase
MPRYKLTVAYDGTHFHGWQKQQRTPDDGASASNPHTQSRGIDMPRLSDTEGCESLERIRTAQGELEHAVRRVLGEPVNVLGASRTDAGVHARGQVAAFTSDTKMPVEKMARAISSRCPPDLQVLSAEIVSDDFDPIKGAIAKGYRYRISHGCRPNRRPLFDRDFVTTTAYRLDPELMNEAARELLGEHDFASFTRVAHGRESTVRTIYECKVNALSRRRCEIEVAGNGFLYNMIRIIAGTLVEVGRGRVPPEEIVKILEARDRSAAGSTMPPEGLCLMWIRYPEETRSVMPA